MAITCPVCLREMQAIMCFDIELDQCRYCGGTWLDGGELEKLSKVRNVPKRFILPLAYDVTLKKVPEGDRTCPRCETIMKVFQSKGAFIDLCTQCQGIWFDRYELGRVLGKDVPSDDKKQVIENFASEGPVTAGTAGAALNPYSGVAGSDVSSGSDWDTGSIIFGTGTDIAIDLVCGAASIIFDALTDN
jgi:Zn-finger nucleic acid-binding protein